MILIVVFAAFLTVSFLPVVRRIGRPTAPYVHVPLTGPTWVEELREHYGMTADL